MTTKTISGAVVPPKQVSVTINGTAYPAEEGEILLAVALRNKIEIPHLCYEASLSPYGACRLCMIEVREKGKKGKPDSTEMVTSCTLRAKDGLEVLTDTPEILRHRKMLLELYLAEAPKSEIIKSLADRYGVTKTRFFRKVEAADPLGNKCVLCGLCVRVCNEIMGGGVISFVNRGPYTVVATPFFEENPVCLGCGACAQVCPTHAIEIEDAGDQRIMTSWAKTTVKLRKCPVCGKHFAPDILAEATMKKINPQLSQKIQDICPECRGKHHARQEILAKSGNLNGENNHG